MSRRRFGAIAGGAFSALALGAACRRELAGDGRVSARPRDDVMNTSARIGQLELERGRDAILQLPKNSTDTPLPLLVFLHGATQRAQDMIDYYVGAAADAAGVALLVPDSRDNTWDAVQGDGFGRDVAFLNRALTRVFETVRVDPARIAVGGFSDGATYALSFGIINGDVFRRIVAFSPGFLIGGAAHGAPRLFISHGKTDRILPIDRCSRAIVPALRARGYDVTFREFNGGHEVPDEIASDGMRWAAAL